MTKQEIIDLIKRMISEWDSVKTYAAICKRDALTELLDNIQDSEKSEALNLDRDGCIYWDKILGLEPNHHEIQLSKET